MEEKEEKKYADREAGPAPKTTSEALAAIRTGAEKAAALAAEAKRLARDAVAEDDHMAFELERAIAKGLVHVGASYTFSGKVLTVIYADPGHPFPYRVIVTKIESDERIPF